MLQLSETSLIEVLSAAGCPRSEIDANVEKIYDLDDDLLLALVGWVNHGNFADVSAEGFTFESLVFRSHLKPIGAILALDWLRRDPDVAVDSISQRHERQIVLA